jgi:hypothetical protein
MKNKLIVVLLGLILVTTIAFPILGTVENNQNESKLINSPNIDETVQALEIMITRPEKAFYNNDVELIPLFLLTLIFGPITINADLSEGSADKVEFYVDDVLKYTDYFEPFSWKWDETAFFKHTIKVIAYDGSFSTAEDDISVWIFNQRKTPVPPVITIDDVIKTLMSDILEPASSNERKSAFVLTEYLGSKDTVYSDDGNDYQINDPTWFVYVDDDPEAEFAHDTRYVFFDGKTGNYEIKEEKWPPLINDVSLFDASFEDDLIEIFPILNYSEPIQSFTLNQDAPNGDYGDAPDGQDAYYGIPGHYPTLFSTTNSLFGRPGGHTLNVGEETIGLSVSAEQDANDPSDPDGIPNLVDSDKDDRSFVIFTGGKAQLAVTVSVSANAADVPRYINVLLDLDQSGHWSAGSLGKEWVIVNYKINVPPGTTKTILLPEILWGSGIANPSPIWMRVALTRETINESLFSSVGGWDGSGQFEYGEIEDTLVFLTSAPPRPPVIRWLYYWPPLKDNPPAGQPPGGGGSEDPPKPPKLPSEGPCGTPVNHHYIVINCGDSPSSSHMKGECEDLDDVMDDLGASNPNGNIGPDQSNKNTKKNILDALAKLKTNVKCGDYVYILIKGHGDGKNISLYNSGRSKIGKINFKEISDSIGISPCDGKPCTDPGVCCHVKIVVSSCHAGKALKDNKSGGCARQGRSVCTSSNNSVSYGGSGGYTAGFIEGMRESGGNVHDAHDKGATNQKNNHKNSDADSKNQQCECKCPCQPSIVVDKRVWDPFGEAWVDSIQSPIGQQVTFGVLIGNDGVCRDVTNLSMMDILPPCLSYEGNARMYLNSEYIGTRPPDSQLVTTEGTYLEWELEEIQSISPGDEIHILFDAETVEEGPNQNYAEAEALCSYDPSVTVSDSDTATVFVTGEEDTTPPVTEKIVGEPNEGDYYIWSYTPIFLEATDDMSGVDYIHYEVWWDSNGDGIVDEQRAEENVYGAATSFTVEQYGIYFGYIELRWYAVDNADNVEQTHYQEHFVYEGQPI